jgi:hypothetical protein
MTQRSTAQTNATTIRDETTPGANTATRVGTALKQLADNGVFLEDITTGLAGAGNAVSALGATYADAARAVTHGGADNTFDVAIPDNSCVRAVVESWVLMNSAYDHFISEVLMKRISGGNVVVIDTTRHTYSADPNATSGLDASYETFAASTTNLRITRKAHASNDGTWTTHVWLTSTTKPA